MQFPKTSNEIDVSSRNHGADYLIIQKSDYNNIDYNNDGYIYLTIEGWVSGQYSLLYRFMDNHRDFADSFEIFNNIPQFLLLILWKVML